MELIKGLTKSEYNREYHKKNKDKIASRKKLHRKNNPTQYKESDKRYYDKKRCSINVENFKKRNPEYTKNYTQEYRKNPENRLAYLMRSRVKNAIKYNSKSQKTLELIGCTPKELREHLESLFKPGMTWGNQGKWHVDHIKPCASFDLSDPEQQKQCFHYSNLQPLWAEENLSKGAKIL